MKNIRHAVFESNSSSTHSFSISNKPEGMLETLPVLEDGSITLTGGSFGWSWEKFTDAQTKANYASVYAFDASENGKFSDPTLMGMLTQVIQDHTGAKIVHYDMGDSSIDHQSAYSENGVPSFFADKDTLKNWIFNPKSILFTGNDNEKEPPNLTDAEDTIYSHEFVMGDYSIKLKSYPESQEDIKDLISDSVYQKAFSDYPYPGEFDWENLSDDDQAYWVHHEKRKLFENNIYYIINARWEKEFGVDSFSDIEDNIVLLYQKKYDDDLNKEVLGKSKVVSFLIKEI